MTAHLIKILQEAKKQHTSTAAGGYIPPKARDIQLALMELQDILRIVADQRATIVDQDTEIQALKSEMANSAIMCQG